MKIQRLLLIVFVAELSGVLFLAAAAQEVGPLISPTTVLVSAGESPQRLMVGDAFKFQLRFDPAPDGYGGGEIRYLFRKIGSDPATTLTRYNQNSFSSGGTQLHDGQAIYTVSLPIADYMVPGTWKLQEVTLGRSHQSPVPVPANITFEVLGPTPAVVHVEAPASVRAGGRLTFKITLIKYPNLFGNGCVLRLSGSIKPAMLNRQSSPDEYRVAVSPVELNPDQHSYEMSGSLISDVPPGPWQGELLISAIPRPSSTAPCRSPQVEGDARFAFAVEPAVGLVTPISVAVTVNPSQIELLHGEADRLKAKAQHIGVQLSSGDTEANQVLLQKTLQESLSDVDRTEAQFKQKGSEQQSRAVNTFFDDIRFDYREALKFLVDHSAQVRQAVPRLERASLGTPSLRLNRASQAVLTSIVHNAKAYDVLASSGSLTFTLEVSSTPDHATVSYRQRLEPEFKPLDHDTDWRIPNLYHATYLIKFQKPGCEEQLKTFLGGESDSTNLHVDLVCKGRAR
jgi:hypothetical protein